MAVVKERDDGLVEILLGAEEVFELHKHLDMYGPARSTIREIRGRLWDVLRDWIVGAR